ncbi:MAG: hypothetical protein WBE39_10445 [Candidatus Competibacter sp.]
MKSPPLSAPAWLYRKPSWLQRLALGLVSILALVATFAVASVVFAALLVIGLAAGGWLWWQYRKLARRARDARPAVLEGEYEIEPGPPALEDRAVSSRPTVDSAPPHPRVP